MRVDGARVIIDETKQYLAPNKPRGMQSTMADDQGRSCIGDIIAERVMAGHRMFHVGRLDADTEGLLLLTNDGELAHRLMHPSYEVPKTYMATVKGEVPRSLNRTLRAEVEPDDGPAGLVHHRRCQQWGVAGGDRAARGPQRIVRRLMEEVGFFPVRRLLRTQAMSPSATSGRSALRVLGCDEIGGLYEAVGL